MGDFLKENRALFEEKLLSEAVNVRDKIEEIRVIGNINLLKNAQKLVLHVVDEEKEELVAFAQQEGIAWAKFSLTLAFKLEWVQAIRRTLWHFLYEYDKLSERPVDRIAFYDLESKINEQIDEFLNNFFISYSRYKDDLIESQRQMVEKLSVPIIPISSSICILPLIGSIDAYRSEIIEEKILLEIGKLRIQTLIIDLSGIVEIETEVMQEFLNVLDGISMMGCKPVITGIRSEVARNLIQNGVSFEQKAVTSGTLEQALNLYAFPDPTEKV
nr:STAS domain-containing protein [Sediminibacillus massiliensis]